MTFSENEIMAFWERLKTILKSIGKTQIDLCNDLGYPLQTFKNKKVRKTFPSIEELFNIAEYLNVSVEYLVTGEEKDIYKGRYERLREKIEKAMSEENENE